MPDNRAIEIEIRADLATVKGQLGELTSALRQVSTDLAKPGGPADGFGKGREGLKGFEDQIKSFARTQRSEARTINFFVSELSQIVPVSNSAKAALGGFGQVLLAGGGIVGGIFAVGAALGGLISIYREFTAEVKKAGDELKKTWDEAQTASDKAAVAVAKNLGGEGAGLRVDTAQKTIALTKQHAAATAELTEKEEELAALRERQGTSDIVTPAERKMIDEIGAIKNRLSEIRSEARALMATSEEAARKIAENEKKQIKEGKFHGPGYGEDMLAFYHNQEKAAKELEGTLVNLSEIGMGRFFAMLRDSRKEMEQLVRIGASISEVFGNLGAAFGGSAGAMLAQLGQLISKAIALAVAMAATGGPFAWVNLPATLAAITAVIASIPKFEAGTPYVPRTGLAMLHEGERVVPAVENRQGWGGPQVVIQAAALDQAWWNRQERRILRSLSRATRNRRGAA